MKTNLHHVSLFTNDLERSLFLFKDLLGFEEIWRIGPLGGKGMASLFGLDDIRAQLVMLQSKSGFLLELILLIDQPLEAFQGPPALPAPASLSLEVEDLDSLHQSLGPQGWTPFTPVTQIPTPDGKMVRMFCIRTDENVLLELLEAPPP
jgi:catechol 2,3-dioxygenase-like lactoylglutathione lyase family enzyme